MKKWVLCIAVALTAILCTAVGAAAETYGDLEYTVYNDGFVTITDCDTSVTSVEIPERINGMSVTGIDSGAFAFCDKMTSINIPESVTAIGEYAFHACYSLESVTIPDSVTNIGKGAFYGCNMSSVTVPGSVKIINDQTFASCNNLRSVVVQEGVTSIGDSVFINCAYLTSVTLPDSLTDIGKNVFHNCHELKSITIPEGVTVIGQSAFYSCNGLTSITLPSTLKSISNMAFVGCSFTNITIPEGVTSIGNNAFNLCGELKSIIISDSVTTIADYAFLNCSSLTDVYYSGTESQWNSISIGSNDYLTNATIHYNSTGPVYPQITSVTPIIDNGVISGVTVNLSGIETSCVLLAAFQNGENTVDIKTSDIAAGTGSITVNTDVQNADGVTVFVWDSLSGMIPLCDAVNTVSAV